MINNVVLGVCYVMIAVLVYMFIRNNQVYRERTKCHNAIFKKHNGRYINNLDETTALLKERETIASYQGMFWTIWKRPSSFYKEFIERVEAENKRKMEEDRG